MSACQDFVGSFTQWMLMNMSSGLGIVAGLNPKYLVHGVIR